MLWHGILVICCLNVMHICSGRKCPLKKFITVDSNQFLVCIIMQLWYDICITCNLYFWKKNKKKSEKTEKETITVSGLFLPLTYICTLNESSIEWSYRIFMIALWNRADNYIFILWFLLFSFFFFPRLISVVRDWMCTILPHMVWP